MMNLNERSETIINRLHGVSDLHPLIERLTRAYALGPVKDFYICETGYEDCNAAIQTENGKFLAKIFSKNRTPETIIRYADIMKRVVEEGIRHPKIYQTTDGRFVYQDLELPHIHLVLMQFIEGKTFLELDRTPDDGERREVLKQAALVNRINYQPTYLFDSWAIPNNQHLFEKVEQYIQRKDLPLVKEAIHRFESVPIAELPCCFVHGDFTKANILKSPNGDLSILDFSVSNWYPRIQELAVIVANLLHGTKDGLSLEARCKSVADEYCLYNALLPIERLHLQNYALAAMAMEFMGSHLEKYINGNDTPETDYWLRIGREGLQKTLSIAN